MCPATRTVIPSAAKMALTITRLLERSRKPVQTSAAAMANKPTPSGQGFSSTYRVNTSTSGGCGIVANSCATQPITHTHESPLRLSTVGRFVTLTRRANRTSSHESHATGSPLASDLAARDGIMRAIEHSVCGHRAHLIRDKFMRLLRRAKLLVGNSSAGLMVAARRRSAALQSQNRSALLRLARRLCSTHTRPAMARPDLARIVAYGARSGRLSLAETE